MSSIRLPSMEPVSTAPSKNTLARLPFFILCFFMEMIFTSLATTLGGGKLLLLLGMGAMLTILAALRLSSIGWHPVFCSIGLVPFVNEAFAVVLLALPENYAKTRQLDSAARIILVVFGILLLARYALLLVPVGF